MEQLKAILNKKIEKSKYKDKLLDENRKHGYPFNKYEYIITHLISEGLISIEEYEKLRKDYIDKNKYLSVYEMTAPRTFGEKWAQKHLNEIVPELKKPSKFLDPNYKGQYDFWYNGIAIEVKASRAVKRESGNSLIEKAIGSDSNDGFDMNFQQLKPGCCDVFVWIAVWTDIIQYWVLNSEEVKNNQYYSNSQHRGNNGEGQLWIKESNIKFFDEYKVEPSDILNKIIQKSNISNLKK